MNKQARRLRKLAVAAICAAGIFARTPASLGQEAQQPPVPSTPPAAVQNTPAQSSSPSNNVRPALRWKRFDYTCEGGAPLTVFLHNQTVKVSFKDKMYFMKQVPSADGGRYSDGKVVWWSVGNGGFLQEDPRDGNGAMMAKDCKMQKGANPDAAAGAGAAKPLNEASGTTVAGAGAGYISERLERPGAVTGTVSYLVRMALPPDAVIAVQVQDVSRADAPANVIAEDQIKLGDRQVPVPFELKIDPARIDAKHTYAVSAKILVDGLMRFRNDKAYHVLTHGNPSHVDIIVKQLPAQDANHP
jgi:uncharacterized lipoprotein YbaY/membrane-bound inhibitor of C-type lysozyme